MSYTLGSKTFVLFTRIDWGELSEEEWNATQKELERIDAKVRKVLEKGVKRLEKISPRVTANV